MKIKWVLFPLALVFIYFLFNVWQVHDFAKNYSEQKSDVAIILGAGTHDGKVSPVFRERLNHEDYLLRKRFVKTIVVTGGFGKGEVISDSRAGKAYLLSLGKDATQILIDEKSTITRENIIEAKKIMNARGMSSALIVSDPLHMKRSMRIVRRHDIIAESSPTQTSAYKTWWPKLQSFLYEAFFLSIGQ